MAKRGKNKKSSQAEKLLTVLLSGKEVSVKEINETLSNQIEIYRLSTYLYDLKQIGAKIEHKKLGKKLNSFILTNVEEMTRYMEARKPKMKIAEKMQELQEMPVLVQHEKITETTQEDVADPNEEPPMPIFSASEEVAGNF